MRLPAIAGWEHGRVWVDWKVDPETLNVREVVFGGYLATLIDFLGALAFLSTLEDSESFTTTVPTSATSVLSAKDLFESKVW